MKINDKLLHFICCFIVSACMACINGLCDIILMGVINSFACGVAIGIGKEYGDSKAKGNKWDWKDIFADALGALIGSLTILFWMV